MLRGLSLLIVIMRPQVEEAVVHGFAQDDVLAVFGMLSQDYPREDGKVVVVHLARLARAVYEVMGTPAT